MSKQICNQCNHFATLSHTCGLRVLNIVFPVANRKSIKILPKQIQMSIGPRIKLTQHASEGNSGCSFYGFHFLKRKCFILLQLNLI